MFAKASAVLALAGLVAAYPSGVSVASFSGSTVYDIYSSSYIVGSGSSVVVEKGPTQTTTISGPSAVSLASSLASFVSADVSVSSVIGTPMGTFSSAAATATSGGSLMVNTPPSLLTCEPAAVTFSGGVAPYFLSVLPGGQSGAEPLEQFPEQTAAGSYVWTVNIAAGTSITLRVSDSTGVINYSSPITILAGASTSCIS